MDAGCASGGAGRGGHWRIGGGPTPPGGRGHGPRAPGAGWAAAYAALAVLFGLATAVASGWTAAGQFYAGYLTEYSLSLDNLFIFYVIMARLAGPAARHQRLLMAGLARA